MRPMADETELSQGERSVLLLHPHWKILLRPTLLLLVVVVAAALLAVSVPPGSPVHTGRIGAGVVAVAAVLTWFAIPFLRWQTTPYELTTRRLRLREGILSRSGRDFPLIRISDISFSHGLIDRLLGSGTLVVESAGEHGQPGLTEIPQVGNVPATRVPLVRARPARVAPDEPGT